MVFLAIPLSPVAWLFAWVFMFIASLFVLVQSSKHLTNSAENIGVYFKLPEFVTGVAILAVGSSIPELATSIASVFSKSSEIVVGNVLGSNITNIFLVLGVTAIIGKRISLKYNLMIVDVPFLIGSAFLLLLALQDLYFSKIEAVLFLAGIMIYMAYLAKVKKLRFKKRDVNIAKQSIVFILSAALLCISAKYAVQSVVELSNILNIGTTIIAASVMALATSLPELLITIHALRKHTAELAIGNILGSNVFNSLAVMGIPAMLGTLTIPKAFVSFAMPLMIIATLMYFFMLQEREITKWEGYLLIVFYLFFITKLFTI